MALGMSPDLSDQDLYLFYAYEALTLNEGNSFRYTFWCFAGLNFILADKLGFMEGQRIICTLT